MGILLVVEPTWLFINCSILNLEPVKHEKFYTAIGPVLILAGSVFKVLHWPYGNLLILTGLIILAAVQTAHVSILKQRVKELEGNSKAN